MELTAAEPRRKHLTQLYLDGEPGPKIDTEVFLLSRLKPGDALGEEELRALVDKVQSGEVRFCPHGRPVAVKLTRYELEKMFRRA